MTFRYLRGLALTIVLCGLAIVVSRGRTMAQGEAGTSVLQGHVRDSSGRPVADAMVWLQRISGTDAATTAESPTTHTDSAGAFYFSGLGEGAYSLRAEVQAGKLTTQTCEALVDSLRLARDETKTIDMVVQPRSSEATNRAAPTKDSSHPFVEPAFVEPAFVQPVFVQPASAQPEFFDEPQFTVAGIAQATNSGGHGSDTVLRNSEALVRETVSLGHDAGELPPAASKPFLGWSSS